MDPFLSSYVLSFGSQVPVSCMIAMRGFPKEGQEVEEGAGLFPWGCLLALSLPVLWVLFLLYWPGPLQLLGFSLSPINALVYLIHLTVRRVRGTLTKPRVCPQVFARYPRCPEVSARYPRWTGHTRTEMSYLFHTLSWQLGLLAS